GAFALRGHAVAVAGESEARYAEAGRVRAIMGLRHGRHGARGLADGENDEPSGRRRRQMRRQAGMRARRAHGRTVKLQQEFTRSRMFVHVPFCPVRALFFSAAALRYNALMQSVSREGAYPSASFQPFELVNADGSPRFLIVCDHASNALPEEYGALGLDAEEFGRHIAYDIGAGAVARLLGDYLGCPAVLARFSRLLIDLNRAADDPTLVMKFSD